MKLSLPNSLSWRLFISYSLILFVGLALFFLFVEWLEPVISQSLLEFNDRHLHLSIEETALANTIHEWFKQSLRQAFIISFFASLSIATLLSIFFIRQIVRPLQNLTAMSDRIAKGEYSQRLNEKASKEFSELIVAFNSMATTLQQSEEHRIRLMRNYAHEFRTPLSALRGTLQGISDGVFQADEETLETCHRQLNRLVRLLEDLTLLAKVESHEISVKQETFNLTATTKQCLQLFGQDYADKGVELRPLQAEALLAKGDKERTSQILTNLLNNALRHTQAGGSVTTNIFREANNDLRVEVSDTGEGIPLAAQDLIFQRFYRVDSSRSYSQQSGSGIGLTISQHLVKRQGGEIGVLSEPNKGSTFWFTIPAA